ncbi:hypothetical protein [Microvirga calopogonii]|uniref:hypothetical protein n=1 Tax=Microvirga calopogonii TaxID=2078013 RepID=UPI000E0E0877|nr:hypothetical protein [Microvirga calopogonii]
MHKTLQKLCDALDKVSTAVLALNPNNTQRVTDLFGTWNVAPLTLEQISDVPKQLSVKIKAQNITELDDADSESLLKLVASIEALHPSIIPHMGNSNISTALPPYLQLINVVADQVARLLGWEIVKDKRALPSALARRVETAQSQLDTIVGDLVTLEAKVEKINNAHDTAEELPTTLDRLKRDSAAIERMGEEASQCIGRIKGNDEQAKNLVDALQERSREGEELVSKCAEAYRVTTSVGLAAAFDDRATKLNRSVNIWVGCLVLALLVGMGIGYGRVQALSESLNQPAVVWTTIWAKVALAAVSLAAPLWFAWLATKQIGQRFRLAEDYAFKASVAKAYEGYRREAARFDKALEARLFGSALTRLEEAPLRLVELETHGSPWHELLKSAEFKKALELVPGLGDRLRQVSKAEGGDTPLVRPEANKEIRVPTSSTPAE